MKYRLLPPSEVGVEEWPRRAEQDIAEMFIHFDALARALNVVACGENPVEPKIPNCSCRLELL